MGVLIKGSNYMETLSQAKYVVFDKTGTLTQGVFEVTGIHHNKMEEAKLLEYAAFTNVSLILSVRNARRLTEKEIDRSRVEDIQAGEGILAKVDKREVAAGNSKLMKRLGIAYRDCHKVGTIIHMAVDGAYAGHIVISDVIKPNAEKAVKRLKNQAWKKPLCSPRCESSRPNRLRKHLGLMKFTANFCLQEKWKR